MSGAVDTRTLSLWCGLKRLIGPYLASFSTAQSTNVSQNRGLRAVSVLSPIVTSQHTPLLETTARVGYTNRSSSFGLGASTKHLSGAESN